jgi:bifunctional UDP-N-acetylglucosamine pyrophosphorylase/glucosamine-1-phosphate N-acetyltransferase
MKNLSIIVLAAGKGTRMKSDLPKVMHKVAGREMLNMVLDEAQKLEPQSISIVVSEDFASFQEKIIAQHSATKISFALQKVRKGTADAVKTGLKNFKKPAEKFLILYGDTPLIHEKTLRAMLEKIDKETALCILGFDCLADNAYGRLVVDVNGNLEKIIEFKDASVKERKISLCNSGVVAVRGALLDKLLAQVKNNNASGEFYLTDIVGIACKMGLKCGFIKTNEDEVLGVNSRVELAKIEAIKQNELRKKHMEAGVTLVDPASVYFACDTKISSDVIIHPHVVFGENVVVEKNVELRSFCHIEGASIGSGSVVGPFARIRPETKIGENVRVGNFVEIKKSLIKKGAKINHLSYVGDSEIGVEANIGAGVITCNYDGYKKFKTIIGDEVFVGSNSALVAPVKVGNGAVIGAGSVVTQDVAADDLAVSRARQVNIAKGGKKYRQRKTKK